MEQHKLGSYRLKVTFLFYLLIILIFGSILFIRNFTYKVYADPTVVFSSLEYDGSVRNSGSNYATVWSGSEGNYIFNETVPIGQRYVALTYYVMRGFLFFNTSSIPDYATINSTILSLNITVDGSTTDFNLTVYKPETYGRPSTPIELADYNYQYYDTSEELGRLSSVGITVNNYINITLTPWVNVTGITKLILRTDREFSQITPSSDEYLEVSSQESNFPAKLYVIYTTKPTVVDSQLETNFVINKPCIFKIKWEAWPSNLSHYIFSWNATGTWANHTALAFPTGVNQAWSNITKTLPDLPEATISWKIYANDTEGKWGVSQIYHLWLLPLPESVFREEVGFTAFGGRNLIEYDGATNALYYAFLNSTTGEYMIKAYNKETYEWTDNFIIGTAPTNDHHWMPSVGVFPNGCIAVFFGYAEVLSYRMTVESADIQSNLTTLITNWTETRQIRPYDNITGAYPLAISWDDRLIVVFRFGAIQPWCYYLFNGSTNLWEPFVNLTLSPGYRHYLNVKHYDNVTIVYGFMIIGGETEDPFMLYTDDKAESWKHWNGTTLTLPVNTDTVKMIDYDRQLRGVELLDGKPVGLLGIQVEPGKAFDLPEIEVVYYNNTLGSPGTWKRELLRDELNKTLKGWFSHTLYTPKYEKPYIWFARVSPDFPDSWQCGNITKYLATDIPWRWQKTYTTNIEDQRFRVLWVYNVTEIYEGLLSLENKIIGTDVKGNSSLVGGRNMAWGTNFTATQNGTLVGFQVWLTSSPDEEHHIAIYNATFHLLANTTGSPPDVRRSGIWSIILALSEPATITEGESYWLMIDLGDDGERIAYEPTSIAVNQSCYWNYTGWPYPFPDTVTPDGYENYTLSIFGVEKIEWIIGSCLAPEATNIGATENIPGSNSTFHAYWTNRLPLDTAVFYWNASGAIQSNGTMQLTGTGAWSNFTRTLPNQTTTLTWYIIANNTDGLWGNTTTQYLNVGEEPLNVSFSLSQLIYWQSELIQGKGAILLTLETITPSETLSQIAMELLFKFTEAIRQTSTFATPGIAVVTREDFATQILFEDTSSLSFQSAVDKSVILNIVGGTLNSTDYALKITRGGGYFRFSAKEDVKIKITYTVDNVKVSGDQGKSLRTIRSGSVITVDSKDNVLIQWDIALTPLFPLMAIIGIVGLAALFIGPSYGVWKMRKGHYYDGFVNGLIITVIGIALFMAWLW